MARVNSIYLALLAGLLILVVSNPGWAHDAAYPGNLSILNVYDTVEYVHADADDGYGFKGSFTLTVTNNSSVAWGDFHFQIFQVDTNDYSQVYFTHDMVGFSGPSGSNFDYTISGDGMNPDKILDFTFYDNPVAVGETATFTVYTDNTAASVPFFGISFYATPVPAPASALLLVSGLAGLMGIRRKNNA